jgi:hypothetical protein
MARLGLEAQDASSVIQKDYCVAAGWVSPTTYVEREAGRLPRPARLPARAREEFVAARPVRSADSWSCG